MILEKLEPYEGKLSRTVPRGARIREDLSLTGAVGFFSPPRGWKFTVMSMKGRIRELLRAEPFQPFVIRLADGREYRIDHP